MFTGIVTEVGTVSEVNGSSELTVKISAPQAGVGLEPGASIACDGVCLTAVECGGGPNPWFVANASRETLQKTILQSWEPGSRVNLERPLRVGDELGGHIVAGHVDGIAEVVRISAEGESRRVRLRVPGELASYIAPKGSVALNGVSLTVNDVDGNEFEVNLIPFTLAKTNWSDTGAGARVNIEVDLLARYVARIGQTEA